MRAAVYKGNQRLVVEEVATPEPGPGQVLVSVKYCAICGTDVHGFLYDMVPPGTVLGPRVLRHHRAARTRRVGLEGRRPGGRRRWHSASG